jgi:hypothetical protein
MVYNGRVSVAASSSFLFVSLEAHTLGPLFHALIVGLDMGLMELRILFYGNHNLCCDPFDHLSILTWQSSYVC